MNEKQLKYLAKLQREMEGGAVQPDELIEIVQALLSTIKEVRSEIDTNISDIKSEANTSLKEVSYSLSDLELRVKDLINGSERNSLSQVKELSQRLSYEIDRIEQAIPDRVDLSSIERKINELEGRIPTLPEPIVLDNPQQIADKINTLHETIRPETIIGWNDLDRQIKNSLPKDFDVRIGVSKTELRRLEDRVTVLEGSGGGSGTWYQDQTPSGTKNGVNTTFTLANTPTSVLFLYLNGQYLVSGGTDYTRSGTTITMVVAPLSTDALIATYS